MKKLVVVIGVVSLLMLTSLTALADPTALPDENMVQVTGDSIVR